MRSSPALPHAPRPLEARAHILLILDSCRFDTFVRARPRFMTRLGPIERRYSSATWTAPAHYNLLCGLYPHRVEPGKRASEVYDAEFSQHAQRLGLDRAELTGMLPSLWLPSFLQRRGFFTQALVSLPVINPSTPLNQGFSDYRLMERRAGFGEMLRRLRFFEDRPSFHLLNLGETHYPYGAEDSELPHLHGLHGICGELDRSLREGVGISSLNGADLFSPAMLRELKQRQIQAVQAVDPIVSRLFDLVPKGTWITITADHGELFGEEGCFGHGPFKHQKVLEVPFLEGALL